MITRNKIRTIQDKIKLAIAKIEKEENVSISFSSSSFTSAYYTTKMKVQSLEKVEEVLTVHDSDCRIVGFTQNVVGMSFISSGCSYKIVDIKTRNRKYPVIAERSDGRKYKFPVDHVKVLLGGDKMINRNNSLDRILK